MTLRAFGGLMTAIVIAVCAVGAAAAAERVVIGKISSRPTKQLPQLMAMADYLNANVEGIAFDVLVVPTVEAAIKAFEQGDLHMISETVFGALEIERAGVGKVRLAEWKDGKSEYHSVIVALAESDVQSIEDLRGRQLLFQDETSSSGHFLPRLDLAARGFAFESTDAAVYPKSVRYKFAGEAEQNLVIGLVRGLADAIALSDSDWQDADTVPVKMRDKLRIVHETAPMLRSTTVLSASLSDATTETLVETLTTLHERDAAAKALEAYYGITRFDRIEGRHLELLDSARGLYAIWPQS